MTQALIKIDRKLKKKLDKNIKRFIKDNGFKISYSDYIAYLVTKKRGLI